MASRWTLLADVTGNAVLAEDLRDAAGRLLYPAGARLGPAQWESLARLGVDRAPLVSDEPAGPAETARIEALERHLDELFRDAGGGPAARRLRDLLRTHRLAAQAGVGESRRP